MFEILFRAVALLSLVFAFAAADDPERITKTVAFAANAIVFAVWSGMEELFRKLQK